MLQYLKGLGPTATLSLKSLTHKLVMLLALTRPSRSADLASLNLDRRRFSPEGVAFLPSRLAKQSRQGRPLVEYFFPLFAHDPDLCPVRTLRQYGLITSPLRGSSNRALFLAMVKPHLPVASCTIARWLKKVLEDAGIDVSIFSAYSVRGASSAEHWLALQPMLSWRQQTGVQSLFSGVSIINHVIPPHMVMQYFQLLIINNTS